MVFVVLSVKRGILDSNGQQVLDIFIEEVSHVLMDQSHKEVSTCTCTCTCMCVYMYIIMNLLFPGLKTGHLVFHYFKFSKPLCLLIFLSHIGCLFF